MRTHPGVGIFVGALALSLANCSSSYRDYCDAVKQCEGGNDADGDACVSTLQGQEDVADAYDCGDEYTAYVECLEGTGRCENQSYRTDEAACSAKGTALGTCLKAKSGKKDGPDLDL